MSVRRWTRVRGAFAASADRAPAPGLAWGLVLLCAVLAALLRIVVGGRSGVWRDEAQFLRILELPGVGEMLSFVGAQQTHPPLFYMVFRGWRSLTGPSPEAGLYLSIAFGVALVPVVFVLLRQSMGVRVGVAGALLAAISPSGVLFGSMLRPYALLALGYAFGVYALWRTIGPSGRRWAAAYAAVRALMLYTHYLTLLLIVAEALAVACIWVARRSTFSAIARVFLAQCAIGVATLPLLPFALGQVRAVRGHEANLASLADRTVAALELTSASVFSIRVDWSGELLARVVYVVVAWAAYGIAVALGLRQAARPGRQLLVLFASVPLAFVVLAIAASSFTNFLVPHVLSILAPSAVVLAAAAVGSADAPAAGRRAFIAVVCVLGVGLVLLPRTRSNGREVAAVLRHAAGPGDVLAIVPETAGITLAQYYTGAADVVSFPAVRFREPNAHAHRVARFADEGAYSVFEHRLAETRRSDRDIWFVTLAPLRQPELSGEWLRDRDRRFPVARAYETFQHLRRLYGEPEVIVSSCREPAFERLLAMRFTTRGGERPLLSSLPVASRRIGGAGPWYRVACADDVPSVLPEGTTGGRE